MAILTEPRDKRKYRKEREPMVLTIKDTIKTTNNHTQIRYLAQDFAGSSHLYNPSLVMGDLRIYQITGLHQQCNGPTSATVDGSSDGDSMGSPGRTVGLSLKQ